VSKVRHLPVRRRPVQVAPLSVVRRTFGSECRHAHVAVDERLAQVTCRDCKAQLNPIWVLAMLAREDERLHDRWMMLRAESVLLADRKRAKCRHCGKMTEVRTGASYHQLLIARNRLSEDEST
jgi:Zn finger protein HypA/HybF involved in hydrogenase expression